MRDDRAKEDVPVKTLLMQGSTPEVVGCLLGMVVGVTEEGYALKDHN